VGRLPLGVGIVVVGLEYVSQFAIAIPNWSELVKQYHRHPSKRPVKQLAIPYLHLQTLPLSIPLHLDSTLEPDLRQDRWDFEL
jgi:hypothetical protein